MTSENKNSDNFKVYAYVAVNEEETEAYAIGATHADLMSALMEREYLDTREEFEAFQQEHKMQVVEVVNTPIDNIVEVKHRAILAASETMLKLIQEDERLGKTIQAIYNEASMSDVIADYVNARDGKVPPVSKMIEILNDRVGDLQKRNDMVDFKVREPSYKLNAQGKEDRNFIQFSDGSTLDLRGGAVKSMSNKDERKERLEKEFRHNFAQDLTKDVKMFRDWDLEVRNDNSMRMR